MNVSTQKLYHSLDQRSLEQLGQLVNLNDLNVDEPETIIDEPITLEYLKSLVWVIKHRKQGFFLVPLCEIVKHKRKIICPVKGDPASSFENINKQVKIIEIVRDSLPEEKYKGVIFVKTELNF